MDRFGLEEDQPIESKMVSRAVESAQKRVEGNNFDARKQLLAYDDVMRQQRDIIYEQRKEVLESDSLREIIEGMIRSTVERNVHAYTQDEDDENWDLEALAEFLQANVLNQDEVSVDDLKGKEPEEIIEWVIEKTQEKYDAREEELTEDQMREFEKVILLRTVDSKWMDHIDQMDQLRQGIHLRAYGQNDPLQEYQMEGFSMFEEMIASIEQEVAKYAMKAQIRENLQRQAVATRYRGDCGRTPRSKEKAPTDCKEKRSRT